MPRKKLKKIINSAGKRKPEPSLVIKDFSVKAKLKPVMSKGFDMLARHYSISLLLVMLLTLSGVATSFGLQTTLPAGVSNEDFTSVAELIEAIKNNNAFDRYIIISTINNLVALVIYMLGFIAYTDIIKNRLTPTLGEVSIKLIRLLIPLVAVTLFSGLVIVGGLMLLVFPGLLFMLWLMYIQLIVVDKGNIGVLETVKQSRKVFSLNKQLPMQLFVAVLGIFIALTISLAPIIFGLGQSSPVSIVLQQFLQSAISIYFLATFVAMYFAVQTAD